MSRKYKFYNPTAVYFISFATVYWIDVFTRQIYFDILEQSIQYCRKVWLLWIFERAGKKKDNVSKYQFWQHHNNPIELWSNNVIKQKIDYIHNNPVVAGLVVSPEDWKYSSARNF
ncbi:transposase [Maribacter sp. R86514]|uniref:transposase n=1 Tax=Maribacter sp. R86514 TaxID=3093854 RepID=UPI0037C982EF